MFKYKIVVGSILAFCGLCAVIFQACGTASSNAPATTSTPTPSTISSIAIQGTPTIVFDHLTDTQDSNNVPDAQTTAFKDSAGNVSVIISDSENFRMKGTSLHNVTIDSTEMYSSSAHSEVITENNYNYDHWFTSPYTLDGTHIYALAHTEWYACLLVGDCSTDDSYYTNSWVTTINQFVSSDSGATFALHGTNSAHLVANFGYTWTGSSALSHKVYHQALNHSGMMTSTRIIKEGTITITRWGLLFIAISRS